MFGLKRTLLAACAAALLSGLPAFAQEKTTLSLATWGASSHPQVKVFTPKLMDGVTQRTNGQVEWKFFPDDTMVKQAFVPTAIPSGQVDISLTTLDNWQGRVPAVAISGSPLWTLGMKAAKDELRPGQPIFEHFDKLLGAQGTKLLALFDIGAPCIFSSSPVETPADLAGRTIRAYSKGSGEALKALGAAPVNISVGDVYSALQRRTIDGTLGGLQGAYGLRHYEVTKHVLCTGGVLGTIINGFVMNAKRYDSLSEPVRKALLESIEDARVATVDTLIASYSDFQKKTEGHGLTVKELTPGTPEWDAWSKALADYKATVSATFDPETVKLVSAAK